MSEKKLITKLEVAPFRAVEISIIGQLERLVTLVVSVQCAPRTPILWSSLHLLNSELFITQEDEFSFSLVCMWAKKDVSFHSLLDCMILKNDLRLGNWSSLRLTFELSASRHDGEQLTKILQKHYFWIQYKSPINFEILILFRWVWKINRKISTNLLACVAGAWK